MTLNIAVCAADPVLRDNLQKQLINLSYRLDIDLHYEFFAEGENLLSAACSAPVFPYHLVMIEVELPGENGISLARSLNQFMPPDTFLVFISSSHKYMTESFSVHPFFYLIEPILQEDMQNLLLEIRNRYLKGGYQLILLSKDGLEYTIPVKDIIYIELSDSRKRDISVHVHGETYFCRGSLSEMAQKNMDIMFRLNRVMLINLLQIHYLNGDKVVMKNGVSLPASTRSMRRLLRILRG